MRAVQERGGDPFVVLADVGVPSRLVEAQDGYVPVRAWYDYLESASLALNDPYLGFEIGYGIDLGSLPTFRSTDLAKDTLATTIWKLMVETERFATYAKWFLQVDKDRATLSIQRRFKPKRVPGQMDAYGLGFFLRMLQSATGSAFSFRQYSATVCLPEAVPAAIARKMQLARGSNTRASHSFPSRWAFSVWSAQPQAKPVRALDMSLHAIRNGLVEMVLDGSCTMSQLAQMFAMSERSLQRQLENLGTCFRIELRRARLSIAKEMLKDPEVDIEEIAERLGFVQPSSFARAFRSWLGETPSEYRKRCF